MTLYKNKKEKRKEMKQSKRGERERKTTEKTEKSYFYRFLYEQSSKLGRNKNTVHCQ